ncbi:hypothetical protein BGZ60DRAFT_522154 [Tricladium varicosporioides]|nr:hypothetical protein BGZ60DRAFT_522154 [Hymenoscyphus varicosporioides]
MEAPLSSPSLHGPQNTNQPCYFAASHASSTQSTAPTSAAGPSQSQGPAHQSQYQPQYQHQHQTSQAQPPASKPNDGTSPFLRDFNLVAEAAKRAQMAVLMRDMEAVGI